MNMRLLLLLALLAVTPLLHAVEGDFERSIVLTPRPGLSPKEAEEFNNMVKLMYQRLSFHGNQVTWTRGEIPDSTMKVTEHGDFLLMEQPFPDGSIMYFTAYMKGGKIYFNGQTFVRK